jgi:hypothetical protein
MQNYIYECPNILSEEMCRVNIEYFEDHRKKTRVDYEKKCDTLNTDYFNQYSIHFETLNVLMNISDQNTSIDTVKLNMIQLLYYHLETFFNNIQILDWNSNYEKLSINSFDIIHLSKNSDKYTYHHNYYIDETYKKKRVVSFIWFLNDVENGGELEFWGNYNIIPTKGKLVIFPAEWFVPLANKTPISCDQYFIQGHIYLDFDNNS